MVFYGFQLSSRIDGTHTCKAIYLHEKLVLLRGYFARTLIREKNDGIHVATRFISNVYVYFDLLNTVPTRQKFQVLASSIINNRLCNKALIMTFGQSVIAGILLLTKGYRCEPLTELISYLMMTRLLQ